MDTDRSVINKQIHQLSLPTMYGMLFTALYDVVDMFWIGMLGKEAVAALTIYLALFWALEILNEIVGTSSVSMLSRSWGAGDVQLTRRIGEQTFVFKALLGSLGAVLLLLSLPFFYRIYTDDPKVFSFGMQYGYLRTLFIPVFFSSYTVNTILRSTSDAKTPMRLLLATAVLNLVLDPVCMFSLIPGTSIRGLGWGMTGSALATCISYTIAFIGGFWYLHSAKAPLRIGLHGIFHLDKDLDKALLTIGLPSGVNMLLRSLVTFIFLKLVALYGTSALAALGIANRIYQFCGMPSGGLGMGSGILVGQRLGSGEQDQAQQVVRLSILNGLVFSLPLVVMLEVFPQPILRLFLGSDSVMDSSIPLMRIYGVCLLVLAVSSALGAAFFGSGHTRPILSSSLISSWFLQIPYALVVVLLFRLDVSWLWAAYLIGDGAECALRLVAFRKRRWLEGR
ncbi:MAG: MATE family efflux transporter [Sphaerochaeta sp.]|uniref:MATE family efflux transporter n=1 Tax=Sphaerochaeta sp. TaxID=1972642 RepID=UPI002FC869F8